MADEDLDLGERDDTSESDFPPSDRLIHTQAYDLSINTLKEQWDDGTLIIPDFQREYVWDNAKASRLIESLLINIPIPVLFFAETPDATYQIVDGVEKRNNIAHGDFTVEATYLDVVQYSSAVKIFCASADKRLSRQISAISRVTTVVAPLPP